MTHQSEHSRSSTPILRTLAFSLVLLAMIGSVVSTAAADDWSNVYGDPGPNSFSAAHGVAVADDGSLYVVGPYYGDFGGHTPVDEFDLFVMKLAPDGSVGWVISLDPLSMDDKGYSVLNFGAEQPWEIPAYGGDDVIDGAGNIWVTIGTYVAVLDSAGNVVESQEGDWSLPGFEGWGLNFRTMLPDPRPAGGVIAYLTDGIFVSYDAALAPRWILSTWVAGGIYDLDSQEVGSSPGMAVTSDGELVLVSNVPGELSFHSVALSLMRFDAAGSTVWSTKHFQRCTPFESSGPTVMVDGAQVVAPFVETTQTECNTDGYVPPQLGAYSFTDGSIITTYPLAPQPIDHAEWFYVCNPEIEQANSGFLPIDAQTNPWTECGSGVPWAVLEHPQPSRLGSGLDAYGIANVRFSAEDVEVPSLIHYLLDSGSYRLDSARALALDESVVVRDINMTSDGTAVVVGSAGGEAVLPQGTDGRFAEGVHTAAARATAPPRAFVTFGSITPSGRFLDDNSSIFEGDIEWLDAEGITKGCNPPANDRFCPTQVVTRGQMAAFLVRAMGLTDDGGGNLFDDDDGTIFEASIDKLATAGITRGCNPSEGNTKFCPNDPVTRGQMAAFLVRAMGYTDAGVGDLFVDDDGSIFEASIDKLATAGVTRGCNPSEGNTRFCPHENVTRGQMAAFLKRALG